MFRTISDFENQWKHESEITLKLLSALTPESLKQTISSEDRDLGRVAWHIVQTIPEIMKGTGLTIDGPMYDIPMPSNVTDICATYKKAAQSILEQIKKHWTDETLLTEDQMYGETWKRGFTLFALIAHEAHHRGQMSVLMRQAKLKVPDIYGPARESWSAYGMAAPAV